MIEVGGYKAGLLNFEEFQHYWPEIEELLDQVPHTWNGISKEQILLEVKSGARQAWAVEDSQETITMVLFTQVKNMNDGRHLRVLWAGGVGEIDEKIRLLDVTLDFFAKSIDCVQLDVVGRDGWDRLLRPLGFKRTSVTMSRPVAAFPRQQ